ncbi:MAG: hypothetical protein COA52_00695 [Hyphomicrobiales bacterium]|nr:MAG: hypothetical protein COA52_00695 [Hyphomicrobiales bacterium]
MAFNINKIRAELTGGGARPTLFEVVITNPVSSIADIKVPFMAKASQIPGHNIGKIEVPYFGRKIPLPGDRVVEDWVTTIINDETFDIRNAMETWSNAINSQQGNLATLGSSPSNYISQATLRQFGKDGSVLRVYEINNIWPMDIATIELGWDQNDTIEEFQVTWACSDAIVVSGTTGDAGGS